MTPDEIAKAREAIEKRRKDPSRYVEFVRSAEIGWPKALDEVGRLQRELDAACEHVERVCQERNKLRVVAGAAERLEQCIATNLITKDHPKYEVQRAIKAWKEGNKESTDNFSYLLGEIRSLKTENSKIRSETINNKSLVGQIKEILINTPSLSSYPFYQQIMGLLGNSESLIKGKVYKYQENHYFDHEFAFGRFLGMDGDLYVFKVVNGLPQYGDCKVVNPKDLKTITLSNIGDELE